MSLDRWLEAHPRVADVLGCAMFAACVLVTMLEGAGS